MYGPFAAGRELNNQTLTVSLGYLWLVPWRLEPRTISKREWLKSLQISFVYSYLYARRTGDGTSLVVNYLVSMKLRLTRFNCSFFSMITLEKSAIPSNLPLSLPGLL